MAERIHACGELSKSETILQEAQRLVYGDRQAAYGSATEDYTRTAALFSALIAHKLTSPITPTEMAMGMILVKLSRAVHKEKRDNWVDTAGYAAVCDKIARGE